MAVPNKAFISQMERINKACRKFYRVFTILEIKN